MQSGSASDILCVICDKCIEDDRCLVKSDGLKTMRKISRKQRCDNVFKAIPTILQEKLFHNKCYKAYTSPGNIDAAVRKLQESVSFEISQRETRRTKVLSDDVTSPESQCLNFSLH